MKKMITVRKINEEYFENGIRYVVADLFSDSKPNTLPTDWTDIKGLSYGDVLAQGSTIMTKSCDFAILGDSWGDWL